MYEHLRTWVNTIDFVGWTVRLDLWDTGRTREGKSELRYALAFVPEPAADLTRRVVIFDGEDYCPSPLEAIDSDECAGGLLSFFSAYGTSIQYGVEVSELPSFTEDQRELLAAEHDGLSVWSTTLEEKSEHDADDHDWESCETCVEQAKRDGVLGPDAKPFTE